MFKIEKMLEALKDAPEDVRRNFTALVESGVFEELGAQLARGFRRGLTEDLEK